MRVLLFLTLWVSCDSITRDFEPYTGPSFRYELLDARGNTIVDTVDIELSPGDILYDANSKELVVRKVFCLCYIYEGRGPKGDTLFKSVHPLRFGQVIRGYKVGEAYKAKGEVK